MSKLIPIDLRKGLRAAPRPTASRYTRAVVLPDGRAVAWNALSGDLSLWDRDKAALWHGLCSNRDAHIEEEDFWARLALGRHVCEPGLDEIELARSLFDQERYGNAAMTLTALLRGAESSRPLPPMDATIRAAVADVCNRFAAHVNSIHALFAGHEPLAVLHPLSDLSLRLAEVASKQRLRYVGAVRTDGVLLLPPLANRLPDLEIHHVEVTLPPWLGARTTFDQVIDNLRAAASSGRLSIHLLLESAPERLPAVLECLDRLAEAGLTTHEGVQLSLDGGVFRVCHRRYGLTSSGAHATTILEHAHRLGLRVQRALPRLLSHCQATQATSYLVLPNGDLHKCWESVADPALRIGQAQNPSTLSTPTTRRPRWMIVDPFSDVICSNCDVLPMCAGHCADLFSGRLTGPTNDMERPCPDVLSHLDERILAAARIAGLLPSKET